MVACKILFFCLAVVAMKARESQSQMLKNSLTRDCTCFPTDKDSLRISKLADKHGKHVRTVVYLYRHEGSRQVTVYVPDEEKQIKFPDLTVNSLEFYGLHTLEHLYQLFNKPSKILTKLPVEDSSQTIVDTIDTIDTQYIDVHIPEGSKHHTLNNLINTHGPHVIDINSDVIQTVNGKKTSSTDLVDIDVDFHVAGKKETDAKKVALELQKHKPEPTIHVVDSVNIVPGATQVVSNYVNRPKDIVVDTTNLIQKHDIHNHLNHDDHLHNIVDDVHVQWEKNKKVIDLYDKTANPIDNINIIIAQDTTPPSILNPNKLIIDKQNIVLTKPTRGTYTILDNVIQDTGYNYINKILELLNGNNNNAVPSSVNLKPVSSPVFDKWLVEEIGNVGGDGSGAVSYDLREIKIRLLLVLEQNGLRFSEKGELYDRNGRVLKISNLKLRRVMISDPVVYKRLGGRKCVPHGIPYLEAVFVSLAYPPTVLGVIPLKMTSLPRCKGGKCHGRACASRNHNHIMMNPKLNRKMNLATTHNNKLEKMISRLGSDDQNEEVVEILTRNEIGINDGHDDHGHDKEPAVHDIDDGLGIRIIGGRPAVSSGTPVSSRGRSGNKAVSLEI